jgi:hypothetical protein
LKIFLLTVAAIVLLAVLMVFACVHWQSSAATDPAFFEDEIVAFERADAEAMPPPGGILFVGSSSIRFWTTLAEDMAPLPVVRRGFGGAHMSHVLHNFERIVVPYAPRAIVVYVGENDIAAGKRVDRVLYEFETFLDLVREELPGTDVWIMSVKPSKLRWSYWPTMERLNERLAERAAGDPRVRYVETGETLLGPDGKPDDVYVLDRLHLNAEGYRRWTQTLRPLLLAAYADELGLGPDAARATAR